MLCSFMLKLLVTPLNTLTIIWHSSIINIIRSFIVSSSTILFSFPCYFRCHLTLTMSPHPWMVSHMYIGQSIQGAKYHILIIYTILFLILTFLQSIWNCSMSPLFPPIFLARPTFLNIYFSPVSITFVLVMLI